MFTILNPGENSLLSESNARWILLNLLSILTTVLLIFALWKGVSEFKDKQWGLVLRLGLASSSNFRMWLSESEWALS